MTCRACGSEDTIIFLASEGEGELRGLVESCLACHTQAPAAAPATSEQPRKGGAYDGYSLDDITPGGGFVDAVRGKRGTPAATPVKPRRIDDKPLDVRKLARARLKELDREIARLTKLQRERDDLSRMLAASQQTDGPSVVPIRKLANQR